MTTPKTVFDFEWDPVKARRNLSKHGVRFEESATVFLDPHALSLYDSEHSLYEERWITMGVSSGGRLLVVSHTYKIINSKRSSIRIISSRKANKKERISYGE